MPAISGHVTNEIKQHDMSVFWIKEETSNQHAGVYTTSLPPPLSSSLHPSLWLTVIPTMAGMTPSLSLYLPLFVHHWPVGAGIWDSRPSIIGLTAGPRRERPCYLDSVMTSSKKKRGPLLSLIGLAWLRFGLEPPYLPLRVHRKAIGSTGRMFGSR